MVRTGSPLKAAAAAGSTASAPAPAIAAAGAGAAGAGAGAGVGAGAGAGTASPLPPSPQKAYSLSMTLSHAMLPRPTSCDSPMSALSHKGSGYASSAGRSSHGPVSRPSGMRRDSSRRLRWHGSTASKSGIRRTSSEAAMSSGNIWTAEDLGLEKAGSVKELVRRLSTLRAGAAGQSHGPDTAAQAAAAAADNHDEFHEFLKTEATFVEDHEIVGEASPSKAPPNGAAPVATAEAAAAAVATHARSPPRAASMRKRSSTARFMRTPSAQAVGALEQGLRRAVADPKLLRCVAGWCLVCGCPKRPRRADPWRCRTTTPLHTARPLHSSRRWLQCVVLRKDRHYW